MKVWLVIDGDGEYNYEVLAIFDNKTAAINYAIESQYESLAGTEFEKSWEEIEKNILAEKWDSVCIREMEVYHSY